MATPCLVLVDGEHYPPVTQSAIDTLTTRGFDVRAALFLGGAEKTAEPPHLGIPLEVAGSDEDLVRLITEHRPDVVLDLSDEPVVGYRRRMRLAAYALLAGVAYQGADFRFDPPPRPRLTDLPTVSVIGTGKRTGKTAVSIELARHWRVAGRKLCIVTMGRGGPPEPMVLRAGQFDSSAAGLRKLAAIGLHAASDYVEDAFFTQVDTVGTRRCGAGLAGATITDNFAAGVEAAEALGPELLIYEGSGTALPPAMSEATVLVMLGDLPPEHVLGYFGPFRLGLADAVVVLDVGAGVSDALARALEETAPQVPVLAGSMRPEPSVEVDGARVAFATTARPDAEPSLVRALEEAGASAVVTVHSLGDRRRLQADLNALPEVDVVLAEIKAAAVDIVLPFAEERGVRIGLVHNRVLLEEGTEALIGLVEARW